MSKSLLRKSDLESLSTCGGFARGVLRISPYDWQDKIFNDLDRAGARVVVRAANGSGKTQTVAAPAALWHAAIFANSLTICTAGVFRQVKEQLFGAIHS